MAWLEFSLNANKDLAEALEDFLLELGAQAVTIQDLHDQAIYEPEIGTTPLWNQNRLTALFDEHLDAETLFAHIQSHFAQQAPENYSLQALEDRDWEREWLKHYQNMCFGEKLWVIPSIYEHDPNPLQGSVKAGDTCLYMDPGLAFGTGTHETTALCLEWLATADLKNKSLIDYGCGSGILAIAARLLGANPVFACDLDPQAVTATKENARRNQLESQLFIDNVDDFRKRQKASNLRTDILIANILAGPLETLAPEFAQLLGRGGIIVLSGILKEQVDALLCCYEQYFDNIDISYKNEWSRLVAIKK